MVEVALRHLEARREEINDLNVFPVADGDTGDNMARTMEAVRQALDRLERDAGEDAPRAQIVRTVAEAALLGARGNSGVITSQIVRGAAEVLATPTGRLVDPSLVVESLQSAAVAARGAVAEPAEGTILTVIDEMAAAAAERLAGHPALSEAASDAEQNALLAELLAVVLEAGDEAVRRTPEQLQVLADAETVDAGAYALVVLVRGMIAGLVGDDAGLPELPHYPAARIDAVGHADSRYEFCLNLILRRTHSELPAELSGLEGLGDSIEVVGDRAMLRVHIHTDDRNAVEGLLAPLGEVHVDSCENMREQIAARRARARAGAGAGGAAVIAVVDGPGFDRIFSESGASTLDGGAKLNPSTAEILTAIDESPGEEAVVLPNSPNVVLAAEEAGRTSTKRVFVAPCHALQTAVEVLATVDLDADAEQMTAEITEAVAEVRTASVAEAARDDREGRFRVGEAIGLVGDEVVAWGTPTEALEGAAAAISEGAEVMTVFCGEAAPLDPDAVGALLPEPLETAVLEGGQRTHWWLISAQ